METDCVEGQRFYQLELDGKKREGTSPYLGTAFYLSIFLNLMDLIMWYPVLLKILVILERERETAR